MLKAHEYQSPEGSSFTFEAQPGTCVVKIETEAQDGLILLPDYERLKVKKATVLSGGVELGLVPGDEVIVKHRAGKRTEGWGDEDYETVFYGAVGGKVMDRWWVGNTAVDPKRIPLDEVIMAKVNYWGAICPLGRQVLLELPEKKEKLGEIYIPEAASWRDPIFTVKSTGDWVSNSIRSGEKYVVHEGAIDCRNLPDGLGLILEEFIYARVT